MNLLCKILTLGLALITLTACQQSMSCNEWTEKDCYHADYYQTPPIIVPDRNYYQSDAVR